MARVPGSPASDNRPTNRRSEPFVKLLRKFQRHRFWRERRRYSRAEAFIDMLFMAYYEPRDIVWNGHEITLEPGEFMTSERILARRWNWTPRTAGRFLKSCETHGELALNARDYVTQGVTQGTTHPGTHVTLRNYAEIHGQVTHPPHPKVTQGVTHYKRRVVQENTTACVASPVDNCGQLAMPAMVARVYEAFRSTVNSTKPPTEREKRHIAGAIRDNDMAWEPIRDMVRDVTARETARGNQPNGVMYGIRAWQREQEKQKKAELGAVPADPRAAGVIGQLCKTLGSPVQRRPDSVPTAEAWTPEQRAALAVQREAWAKDEEE